MTRCIFVLVAAVLTGSTGVVAQTEPGPGLLPALTPVRLVMDAEISSAANKAGDRFPFHVAADIAEGNIVLIPAGSAGEGEVVHAAKSKGGGRAGELILAARFVTVGGKQVRLRSFSAGSGSDHSNAALGVGIAFGLFGMLVRGGELVMPAGTAVSAKTAEDVQLPIAAVIVGAADPTINRPSPETPKEPANE
jgi:hypothetical protein